VDLDKLQELIRILEGSSLAEIEIEEEGQRIRLQKPAPQPPMSQPFSMVAPPMTGAPHAPPPGQDAAEPAALDEGLVTIDSPMVGVFYTAPAPGEPPFVSPGEAVEEGQTVCIIEAMKLMNEVAAKHNGVIEKVLVENAEPVEYGQPLFALRPTG
jgi:acetyl-CoA carboxylase biotin carboxyl carrier protein